jgi:hypothetical protein
LTVRAMPFDSFRQLLDRSDPTLVVLPTILIFSPAPE